MHPQGVTKSDLLARGQEIKAGEWNVRQRPEMVWACSNCGHRVKKTKRNVDTGPQRPCEPCPVKDAAEASRWVGLMPWFVAKKHFPEGRGPKNQSKGSSAKGKPQQSAKGKTPLPGEGKKIWMCKGCGFNFSVEEVAEGESPEPCRRCPKGTGFFSPQTKRQAGKAYRALQREQEINTTGRWRKNPGNESPPKLEREGERVSSASAAVELKTQETASRLSPRPSDAESKTAHYPRKKRRSRSRSRHRRHREEAPVGEARGRSDRAREDRVTREPPRDAGTEHRRRKYETRSQSADSPSTALRKADTRVARVETIRVAAILCQVTHVDEERAACIDFMAKLQLLKESQEAMG